MTTAIVWYRQDLRCQDNPALAAACNNHSKVIPLYLAAEDPKHSVAAAQTWWLHHSLKALDTELKQYNLKLCLRRGSPLEQLHQLIEEQGVEAIYWNRCYEPAQIARDKLIKTELKQRGIQVISFNGSLFNEPWQVKNQSGTYFKVFTPYWKQALKQLAIPENITIKNHLQSPDLFSESLDDWQLLPEKPNWAREFSDYWEPGELGATKKLDKFINQGLQGYKTARNEPAKEATSKLSPHLHFGEISPWKILAAIEQAKQDPACDLESATHFLSELGWREFSYHLLYHYPMLPKSNFKQEFDVFPWQEDTEALHAWQRGLTGYPIIDAGMRELWRTGYMHNRVRMIVASFLIKDLFIDWRVGASWFLDTLLDADLANNSASWQWVAGSGADAAPYFRIFNPVLQGEKFDPQGEYIKRWIPELTGVPGRWLHKPWEAPPQALPIVLGKDYPKPLVDHASARKLALAHYQQLK